MDSCDDLVPGLVPVSLSYDSSGKVYGVYCHESHLSDPSNHAILSPKPLNPQQIASFKPYKKPKKFKGDGKGLSHRLTMISPTYCHIHEDYAKPNSTRLITIRHLQGWVVCDNCLKREALTKFSKAEQAIVDAIDAEGIMPFAWVMTHDRYIRTIWYPDIDSHVTSSFLKFRNGDSINLLYMYGKDNYSLQEFRDHDEMGIVAPFIDTPIPVDVELSADFIEQHVFPNRSAFGSEKGISLRNLFRHNEFLYSDLVNCQSLFGADHAIQIAYSDLGEHFRNYVQLEYEASKTEEINF